MANPNSISKENENNPQRNLNPDATSYGGDEDQTLETGGEGTEVNPGELGNNNEVDLDRSGPSEESGSADSANFGGSGSAGSDTNQSAGGDVAGHGAKPGQAGELKH